MQNYINTSGSLDNAQEEMIGQLESDKGDFDAQYCEVVSNMQVDIEIRMKGEESRRNQELREKLSPLDQAIEALGEVKAGLKTQIGSLEETYKKQ